MTDIIIKIVAGVVATFGFAVIFRLKPSHWPFATLAGLGACVGYFFFSTMFESPFIINALAALICAFLSEVFARIRKAPSTVFLLPGCIALVPGSTLYYTMSNLLNSNYDAAGHYLLLTAEVGIAIGGGIIVSSLFKFIIFRVYDTARKKLNKKA